MAPCYLQFMTTRTLNVPLKGFGAPASNASVQLAVLNILPIPVLDGGHVVFLLAEAVRGKPVPLVWRIRMLNVGFWLLVGVMLLALGNDVLRFFR